MSTAEVGVDLELEAILIFSADCTLEEGAPVFVSYLGG